MLSGFYKSTSIQNLMGVPLWIFFRGKCFHLIIKGVYDPKEVKNLKSFLLHLKHVSHFSGLMAMGKASFGSL